MNNATKQPGAPRTVGVIDIGSNSVRMVIAEVHADGGMEVLERMQRAVRLGHDTFVTGRLSQKTMSAAIAILRDYKRTLESYGVAYVRAVATSAVREAENADAFLDRILMTVNLDVEVVDTPEASRLTVSAVRQAMGEAPGMNRGHALIVEVGGGSALLTILENGEITASEGYNLGSIRMQEVLSTTEEPQERAADLLRHYIANVVDVIKRTIPLDTVESFVAIGGDARFAAHRAGKPTSYPDVSAIAREDFDRLVAECAEHAAEDLASIYGLLFSDAETLAPALLSYQALLHATCAKEMLVSNVSMRDGLLQDVVRYVMGEEDAGFGQSVIHAAKTIGEKYRCDPKHAEHVANLSVRLFDELQKEHGLPSRHRLLLNVAGILHEIGGFVSSRAHHKHSYYLILNSDIYGLRPEDLALVSHVARYHRRSCPKTSHIEYMALPREKRIAINKLAAILRVADALDRAHAQQVKDFGLERRPEEIIIHVRGVSDLAVEKHAVAAKADLFEDIYGVKVRVEEATSLPSGAKSPTPAE